MVDKATIDVLVAASLAAFNSDHAPLETRGGPVRLHEPADADRLGRLLWSANVENLKHLYPRDAGEHAASMDEVLDYRFEPIPGLHATQHVPFLAGRIGAVIQAYDYQCGDNPYWSASPAYLFLCRLQGAILATIPGFHEQGYRTPDRATFACIPAGAS